MNHVDSFIMVTDNARLAILEGTMPKVQYDLYKFISY